MTGDWARQDIFTGISDEVIISVLSKEDPHIQAPLCASVKLNWEWRFHFPSSWPQRLVFFSPGHRWDHPVPVCFGQTETNPVLIVVVMLLQWGAVSKSTSNQTPNDQVLQRPDRGECRSQDRSSAPRSASMGTRATTKKTVSFSGNNSFLQASHSFSESMRNHTSCVLNSTCTLVTYSTVVQFSSLRLWATKCLWVSTTGCICFLFSAQIWL